MPTQNGDVLLGRRASFSAPEPAQVSVPVYHSFGTGLISTFKVLGSVTPVTTKTNMCEKLISKAIRPTQRTRTNDYDELAS